MIKWEMLRTVSFENPSVVTKMSESKKDTNQDIDSNQCSEAQFLSEKKNRIVGDYSEIDILSNNFAIQDLNLYLLQPKVKNSPQNVFKERQFNQFCHFKYGSSKNYQEIASEDNCLFRAIAYAISNR